MVDRFPFSNALKQAFFARPLDEAQKSPHVRRVAMVSDGIGGTIRRLGGIS
jgi:hypothetical protein